MHKDFWINRWSEGKIGFHKNDFHEKLLHYFPQLAPDPRSNVLVPLCGKTRDLVWFMNTEVNVHGFELSKRAIRSFFKENHINTPTQRRDHYFTHFTYKNLTLSSGDIFNIDKIEKQRCYDIIYDRAALVALPLHMRIAYAKLMTQLLKKGGRYLLIIFEYDQEKMEGPPFSIDSNEIHQHFEKDFIIDFKESVDVSKSSPRFQKTNEFKEKVFILTKK